MHRNGTDMLKTAPRAARLTLPLSAALAPAELNTDLTMQQGLERSGPKGRKPMSSFRFEVATHDADADLRRILAETPMPGRVVVSLLREPSYFAAAVVDGKFHQVIAARDC